MRKDVRTLSHMLKEGVEDGGEWDMLANIEKNLCSIKGYHGRTDQSSNTRESNFLPSMFHEFIFGFKLKHLPSNF